jgi:homotetrameric cytidine deaminase
MSWTTLFERSYVPYSHIPKACLVEGTSGKIYAGVRIENISYPLTIPAVQAACSICLSEKDTPSKIYIKDRELEQLAFWSVEYTLEVIETEDPPFTEMQNLLVDIPTHFSALEHLKALLKQAVTTNSDFPVSALLFTEDGYFEGVNVEVSEWTKGICAERVAISKAFAEGNTNFVKMEIHTRKGEISSPCGACRQVITELLPYHDLTLHHADGTRSEHITIDLLPFSFKSSALTPKK